MTIEYRYVVYIDERAGYVTVKSCTLCDIAQGVNVTFSVAAMNDENEECCTRCHKQC